MRQVLGACARADGEWVDVEDLRREACRWHPPTYRRAAHWPAVQINTNDEEGLNRAIRRLAARGVIELRRRPGVAQYRARQIRLSP